MIKYLSSYSFTTYWLTLVFIFPLLLSAQDGWELELKNELYEINWVKQCNDGTLLVGGDKAMAGVHPSSGEILWTNTSLKAVERNTVSMIQHLPYFVAKTKNLMGKTAIQVVDGTIGKALMNSKDEDISIMNYELFPSYNAILFQTKKNKRYELAWYDLEKGSPIWSLDIDKAKGGLGGFLKGKTSFLKGYPVQLANNHIAVIYKKNVLAINLSDGKLAWKNEYKDDIVSVISNDEGNQVFIGVDKKLDIVNASDGVSKLEKQLKLRDKLIDIESTSQGVFLKHKSGFNILNSSNYTLKWEKPHKAGQADQVIPIMDGYISVSKNESSGKITLMDNDGKKIWDKGIEGALVFVGALDKGVFYISTAKSNLLSYEKGKKVNKDDVKIKGSPAVAFDGQNDALAIFSDKKLYTFDLESGASKELAKDIKFKKFDDEKDWVSLEVRPEGYFISASQNNALVKRNGKIAFNNHYKPVSSSRLMGAFNEVGTAMTGVDVQGTMNDIESTQRLMKGSLVDASEDGAVVQSKMLASVSSGNTTVMGLVNDRFMATKESKDHVYIFTKGKKNKEIVKVNKDSGKTVKTIRMKDKSPIYHIDEYAQTVTVVEKGISLKCHLTK